ncbi:hypothetical protein E5198_18025 [Pseudomonas sp. A-1]|nr:hypothetical protein E5198_18025 [Pseudomonas sp. A-1]
MIVPTLRVGTQPVTLCVTETDAERPVRNSHAERGSHHHFKRGAQVRSAPYPSASPPQPPPASRTA